MSKIIDFVLGIAARLSDRRVAYHPGGGGCAEAVDPSAVFESLAMPRQWNTGADVADAYQGGCGQGWARRDNGRSP